MFHRSADSCEREIWAQWHLLVHRQERVWQCQEWYGAQSGGWVDSVITASTSKGGGRVSSRITASTSEARAMVQGELAAALLLAQWGWRVSRQWHYRILGKQVLVGLYRIVITVPFIAIKHGKNTNCDTEGNSIKQCL